MSGRRWYQFGAFRFDGRLLYRGDDRLDLSEREARVLLLLVENAQHLVKKQELLKVYGARADPNNVDQAVARLRKALGGRSERKPRSHAYIDTVQGDGYLFKQVVRIANEVCLESLADYDKGLEWWGQREPEAIWKAKERFEAVLQRDPTCARAYASLGDCYATLGSHSWMPPRDSAARAKAALKKALAYDDSLAGPHATLGFIYSLFEHRWADAEREFQEAITCAPAHSTTRHRYALFLAAVGKLPRALEEVTLAKQLDPLSRTAEVHVATILYWARRYDDAERRCREALLYHRHFWHAHYQLGLIREQQGRLEEAVAEQRRAIECFPEPSPLLGAALARACALQGSRDECRRIIDDILTLDETRGSVLFHLAASYAALGEADRAVEYLWNASERNEVWVSFLAIDPRLDALRQEERFAELLTHLALVSPESSSRRSPCGPSVPP
jgi:tetratricopeptide (TPR) repeat protein